jgi:hypothetical protein
MTRLPSTILLLVFVGLISCAQRPIRPLTPDPNKKFQHDDTAYISVFLFKDGAGACKAKVSPETLLVVRKKGKTNKLKVEWEVVNLCWDRQIPEEITVEFTGGKNPTDPHGKEIAKMPNPSHQVTDKSRDEILRKLKNDPGKGAYDYVIQRKVGTGERVTVVDPRIEYEYR